MMIQRLQIVGCVLLDQSMSCLHASEAMIGNVAFVQIVSMVSMKYLVVTVQTTGNAVRVQGV